MNYSSKHCLQYKIELIIICCMTIKFVAFLYYILDYRISTKFAGGFLVITYRYSNRHLQNAYSFLLAHVLSFFYMNDVNRYLLLSTLTKTENVLLLA